MFAIVDRTHKRIGHALIAVAICACGDPHHKGSTEVAPGVFFRLHALGEEGDPPRDEDSLLLRVRAAVEGAAPGSLFSTERWYDLRGSDILRSKVIARMHEGDSVSVIAPNRLLPWAWLSGGAGPKLSDTAVVCLELRIMDVLTPEEAVAAAERRRLADPEGHEDRALAPFTSEPWISWGGLMYYRIDEQGSDTAVIRTGDVVSIHYQGRSTDGRVFDDTRLSGHPLTFRLGDPDQVIQGIEAAVHMLRKGGRGTFAMRSALAFGERGSAGGVVPPFTPVVYTVEVVDVGERPVP